MPAPLSNRQKAYLAQQFDRAFARLGALARGRGEAWDDSRPAREKFRHEQVALAVGKLGLRCCSQDDYALVKARALHLLGEDGRAMKAIVHGQGNDRRIAEYKLLEELSAGGFHVGYAEAICRNTFKCGVLEASAGQLWKLIYTVRNRAAAKRRQSRLGSAGVPPAESGVAPDSRQEVSGGTPETARETRALPARETRALPSQLSTTTL